MKNQNFYINELKKENILSQQNYQYFHSCQFQKGDCLLYQGQSLEYLYILISGRIKSCHTTSNGNTILTAVSGGISIVGEVEFLNHQDVINDVFALEEVHCLYISVNQYENILLNDLLFMRYLAQTISSKLYNSNQNSSISINYPVENRLASYLISCQEHSIIQDNFVQVAEMIGCSYRQLQRTLNDFCCKNYLKKIKRGQFQIINETALKDLGKDLYYI